MGVLVCVPVCVLVRVCVGVLVSVGVAVWVGVFVCVCVLLEKWSKDFDCQGYKSSGLGS